MGGVGWGLEGRAEGEAGGTLSPGAPHSQHLDLCRSARLWLSPARPFGFSQMVLRGRRATAPRSAPSIVRAPLAHRRGAQGSAARASAPTSTSSPSSSATTLRGRRLVAPCPLRVCPTIQSQARVSNTAPVGQARGRGAGVPTPGQPELGAQGGWLAVAEPRRAAQPSLRSAPRSTASSRALQALPLGHAPAGIRIQAQAETLLLGARAAKP